MTELIKHLNDDSFKEGIAKGVTLVDFYADWCGPCRMIAPVLEELAKEVTNVTIAKVNIDEAQNVTAAYQVMSIPTLIIFKDGSKVSSIVGFKDKETLKSLLQSL